jgi:PAS domain S-box-containing protein
MIIGLLSLAVNVYFFYGINPLLGVVLVSVIPIFTFLGTRARRQSRKAKSLVTELLPFSLLVENSGDFIAMSDANGVIRYMNKAGRKMVGLSHEADLSILKRMDFYPVEVHPQINNEVITEMRTSGYWSGETAYRHQLTGESIPVLANFIQLRDPGTQESMGIAVVARDIRDRRKLERQLDRFFDVSLDMMGIADTSGYYVKLNPAFTEVLGYTREELLAHPCTYFMHPDDVAASLARLSTPRENKQVRKFENRYRTKSGEYRWLSWKSYPDGDLIYGTARDITDELIKQEQMQELSRKAIASSQAKSEFLANMSHEIRTPINGVVGMTSLLLDTQLTEQQLDYAENIKSSSEILLTVINDILDFSKVEAGKLEFENLDFNLEVLIDETAKSLSWIVRNKSLPFVVEMERGYKHLFIGDAGRIRQVLNNLLSNAVKFTPHGGVRLEVKAVQNLENSTEFRFTVHDTGIGLSELEQQKLFHAFTQADASTARKFGGTGLGLSISKHLVEMMGGEIGVTSSKGQGSSFWFTLPLQHSMNTVPNSKQKPSLQTTKYPNAQILIAEDNFVNQKILIAMLAKMGFRAQAVANGMEVLSSMKARSFDLILMDCQMPELDGYETTKRIRSSKAAHATIPVIALTANALKGDRENCLQAGMDDYAAKPVNAADLAQIIERWLDKANATKRAA